MKTLTIHPVWAWAIVHAHKRVENRTWATSYRGPLAIHAGLSRSSDAQAHEALSAIGVEVPEDVPRGAIVGTVELVDCLKYNDHNTQHGLGDILPNTALAADPLASGPVCWILRDPKPLAHPIPARGQQGLWESYAHSVLEHRDGSDSSQSILPPAK